MGSEPYVRASGGWRHSLHPNECPDDGPTQFYPGFGPKMGPAGSRGVRGRVAEYSYIATELKFDRPAHRHFPAYLTTEGLKKSEKRNIALFRIRPLHLW